MKPPSCSRADYRHDCKQRTLDPLEPTYGQPTCTPYFYDKACEGEGLSNAGVVVFHVTHEDIKIFPELADKKTVTILDDEDGQRIHCWLCTQD